jgi:metal transporter CNNM
MNLAAFSISRLRLEVQVPACNPFAKNGMALGKDLNFLLTTILWGNVRINVMLARVSVFFHEIYCGLDLTNTGL